MSSRRPTRRTPCSAWSPGCGRRCRTGRSRGTRTATGWRWSPTPSTPCGSNAWSVRRVGGEDPRRAELLREALGLWRGAAMQDVGLPDSAAFDAAVTRLEELRLAAMEDRFEAEIRLGGGAELVTELTDLVAAHPLRERLVAALMRALAAAGRELRGAARLPAHARGAGRGAGRRPLTGAVRVARRAAAGRGGTAGGEPEDQPAGRAHQLRRPGRRCRRGPRAHRQAPADHADRAGRLGQDQAGHGNRAHAARRPAGRGLAGRARRHRRRRRRGAGDAHRARAPGRAARRGTDRGADGRAHRRDPRARGAADSGQLRARDRGGGGVRRSGARGVPPAADPGDEQGTARHHR